MQARRFLFSDYASAGWSEAINCNDLNDDGFKRIIQENTQAIERRDGKRYTCPIVPGECRGLRAHYAKWLSPDLIDKVISPLCK